MRVKALVLISFFLFGCVSTPVDEDRLAVSKQLVEVMMELPEVQQAVADIEPKMMETVLEERPSLTEEQMAKVSDLVSEEFDQALPSLMDYMAQLYAENFYKSELEDLVEIMAEYHEGYVLPAEHMRLGQKIMSKIPQINRQLGGYGQSLGEAMGDRVFGKLDQDGAI